MQKLNELKNRVEKLNDWSPKKMSNHLIKQLQGKSKKDIVKMLYSYVGQQMISESQSREIARGLGISSLPSFDKIADNLKTAGLSTMVINTPEAEKVAFKGISI